MKNPSLQLLGIFLLSLQTSTCFEQMHVSDPKSEYIENWAGNIKYRRDQILYPTSIEELQQMVVTHDKVRVAGSLHSFNNMLNTPGVIISTKHLKQIDCCQADTVYFEAGYTYIQLANYLDELGFAITNFPSFPHINVIGSMVTGTHGSGFKYGIMASLVEEYTLLTADGELTTYTRGHPEFDDLLVGFGFLGIVVSAKVRVEKKYDVLKCVYKKIPFEQFVDNYEEFISGKEYMSIFGDFISDQITSVWFLYRQDIPTNPKSKRPLSFCCDSHYKVSTFYIPDFLLKS